MHQVPFLEALATTSRSEVVAVYAERLGVERAAQGWRPASSSAVCEVFYDDPERELLLADEAPTTLHVFSGFRCHPAVRSALARIAAGRAAMGVISEAYDGRGIRGAARVFRSASDAHRYSGRISFILAMGQLGVSWFRAVGFPAHRVHPFAYVTPAHAETIAKGDGRFRMIYVGQFIHRKGVDLLLNALSCLPAPTPAMTLVGMGVAETGLRAQVDRLRLSGSLSWLGVVPNEAIPNLMARHDLLVLPSRFDGWGAVVNEALSVGTRVLCSSTCGAADLIHSPELGTVFRSGDVAALAAALGRLVAAGPIGNDLRTRIMTHAQCFSADTVARHFLDVVASAAQSVQPPLAPWRAPIAISHG